MKINGFFTALLILVISACGGREQDSDQQQTPARPTAPRSATAEHHPGKKVYDMACLACHMADGSGVPGMYPPLIQTEWVLEDKERLIRITLEGMSGPIEVKGIKYNNIMPPNKHLSDQQIADVLTFIRQSFGNDASEVTPD
jgi:mono/diheme cytochrome c family protein